MIRLSFHVNYLEFFLNVLIGYPYLSNIYYTRHRYWPPMYYANNALIDTSYTNYSKRKGGQIRFTTTQTDALEKRFVSHKYLSPEDRKILAETLKLTDRQVIS